MHIYDSLYEDYTSDRYRIPISIMRSALNSECYSKVHHDFTKYRVVFKECPQQTNLIDCGVYLCYFIDCICDNNPIDFSFESKNYRNQILNRIILEFEKDNHLKMDTQILLNNMMPFHKNSSRLRKQTKGGFVRIKNKLIFKSTI